MLSPARLLFLYFAVMIVVLSGLAVTRRNPVHAVLLVLGMFLHLAGIYLTLGAEFLAAVQMIVYAGAILVLYLFVVFLVDLRHEASRSPFIAWHATGFLVTVVVFLALFRGVVLFQPGGPPAGTFTVQQLGATLFTTYLLPFEVTGIILLVAVVGGMVLARRDNKDKAALPAAGEEQ